MCSSLHVELFRGDSCYPFLTITAFKNCRGWDIKKRIPTIEKLKEIGIEEFAEVL